MTTMSATSVLNQLLVSGSILLAALSVGCAVTYPGVLLKQLATDNSTIHLDLDTASWMGSIHGVAGIPSIFMPALMQWRGRKVAFVIACLFSITGWVLAYISKSSTTILISESFHGFGAQSVLGIGTLSMSELLSPRFKLVSMSVYLVMQGIGMASVDLLGQYLHWKTVSLITCIPIAVAALAACVWPESPYWLAVRGEYKKCTKAFKRLRGTSEVAKTELDELLLAQKEQLTRDKCSKAFSFKYIRETFNSREFYLPILHICLLLQLAYWSGLMVFLVYPANVMKYKMDDNLNISEGVIFNSTYFLGCLVNIFLKQYFKLKTLVLGGMLGAILCLLSSSAVSYCQFVSMISSESPICFYLLVGYMASIASGMSPTALDIISDLLPVKFRGVGGPLYLVVLCISCSCSLKLAPYLILYINLWGTLLLYAINGIVCTFFAWKYVPETKGRTLQQIEDFYSHGSFDRSRRVFVENVSLN